MSGPVVEDAFKTLVDQFKDPLAFIRELVQNALDAGSTTIDVNATAEGRLVTIEVQDTGDGMDRKIIETKLVRLFASSKDGDKTKIGKFGIGFSSTFSIRPEAVVVDTARGGERWRVMFAPDGTWRLFPLDEAIEGTRVRVIKKVDGEAEATRLIADAKRTLLKWCRYADADIRFAGASIREPFTVASAVSVTVKGAANAPGDAIVVGLRMEGDPVWGFYNKGLTLLEGTGVLEDVPPWASFRARDGALEHTITRDNVIRDDAFFSVIERVREAAHGALLDAALDALEGEHPQRDLIARVLTGPLSAGALKKPAARMKRRVLRDPRGAGVSLADVVGAVKDDRIARVDGPGPLADALERDERFVVCAPATSGQAALIEILGAPAESAHARSVALASATEKEQWDAAPMTHAVRALLEAAGVPVKDVILTRVDDPTGALTHAPVLCAADARVPLARATATSLSVVRKAKRKQAPVVALNIAAPAVQDAQRLAATDPWLAAHLLVQLVFVDDGGDVARDTEAALLALEKRCPTPNA
jgi:hypothetical protein